MNDKLNGKHKVENYFVRWEWRECLMHCWTTLHYVVWAVSPDVIQSNGDLHHSGEESATTELPEVSHILGLQTFPVSILDIKSGTQQPWEIKHLTYQHCPTYEH